MLKINHGVLRLSPLAWGCSRSADRNGAALMVVPTRVGMFLPRPGGVFRLSRCPHSRGDVPDTQASAEIMKKLSPLAWGCSQGLDFQRVDRDGCPHSRGDVPTADNLTQQIVTLSPLAWGCSYESNVRRLSLNVVPTRVGMFPRHRPHHHTKTSCPHSRGDVPGVVEGLLSLSELSPLAWGCSLAELTEKLEAKVVPTRVGMFLTPLNITLGGLRCPHSRGDVPSHQNQIMERSQLSPLAWGCSLAELTEKLEAKVVPTRVGMFLTPLNITLGGLRCPHSRGDVPSHQNQIMERSQLSPLAWGCSYSGTLSKSPVHVVPTRVGMFPC